MYSWGWNQNSQLGHGDSETRIIPQEIDALQGKEFVSLNCGSRFSAAVTAYGSVYTWGRGDDGQLGHAKCGLVTIPRIVEKLEGIKIITLATKGSHCLALSEKGQLYTWGRGDEGQLGHGRGNDAQNVSIPRKVDGLKGVPIRSIACGRQHSTATTEGGDLYTWGCNDDGATGHGKTYGSIFEPKKVESLQNVGQVVCGSRHTLVESLENNSSTLYAFGWNIYGQLGVGDYESRFEPTMIYIPDPEDLFGEDIFDHGLNRSPGEVESNASSSPNQQAKYSVRFSRQSSTSGTTTGTEYNFPCRVVQICSGYRHCFAIVEPLENNATNKRILWAWGWNRYGQLGTAPERTNINRPVRVMSLRHPIHKIAAGGRHTLAVLQRRKDQALRIFAWGRGDDGQLGTGELKSNPMPSRVRLVGSDIHLLSCGWSHSVACERINVPSSGSEGDERQIPLKSIAHMHSIAFMTTTNSKYDGFMKTLRDILSYGNVDAGFAQMLNCLILFLLIVSSLQVRVGFELSLIVGQVIPGAASTVFLSNVFFGAWGDLLTRRRRNNGEPNAEVTALPHGLNTVVFFAYTMLIMGPVYDSTKDPILAYRTSLFATFLLGLLEIPSILIVNWMRRVIPRAAMMSSLAGVSLTFISMTFAFQIFETPSLSLVPLVVILVSYAAHVQLPLKVPSGIAALFLGTVFAWTLRACGVYYFKPEEHPLALSDASIYLPKPTHVMLYESFFDPLSWQYFTVVAPMLLVNIVTNLSCVESAATVGDNYSAPKALLADALLTMVGAMFGNPFPTCIYIGHPAFKAMGAKTGYNYINACLVLLLGVFNGASIIMQFVPEVAGVGLLMWIGIVVTASAFDRDEEQEQSNKSHAAAIALGLVPAIAAWCLQNLQAAVRAMEQVLPGLSVLASQNKSQHIATIIAAEPGKHNIVPFDALAKAIDTNGVYIYGMISLSRGYLLSSIYLASTLVYIIERQFARAALWMLVAALLSFIGAVHSFEINEDGISSSYGFPARGPEDYPLQYSLSYCAVAIVLFLFEFRESDRSFSAWRDYIWHSIFFHKPTEEQISHKAAETSPLLSQDVSKTYNSM